MPPVAQACDPIFIQRFVSHCSLIRNISWCSAASALILKTLKAGHQIPQYYMKFLHTVSVFFFMREFDFHCQSEDNCTIFCWSVKHFWPTALKCPLNYKMGPDSMRSLDVMCNANVQTPFSEYLSWNKVVFRVKHNQLRHLEYANLSFCSM